MMTKHVKESWAVALLATLVSVLGINRYRFPGMEQSFSVPRIFKSLDSNLYSQDIYVQQLDKLYTVFWYLVELLYQFLPGDLEALLFVIYVLCTYLTFLGLILVVRACGGGLFAVLIASFVLLFNRSFLGNDFFLDQDLDTIGPARALVLWAWYFYLTGKTTTSTILQAGAFLIHPLTGVYACVMHALCLCSHSLRVALRNGVVLLVLVSPLLLWQFTSASGFGLGVDPEWYKIAMLRAGDHIAADHWPWYSYFYTAAMMVLIAVLGSKLERCRSFALLSVTGIFALCALGFVLTELVPQNLAIRAQLFRSTTFLGPLSAIVYSLFLERVWREKHFFRLFFTLVAGLTLFSYSPYLSSWAYGLITFSFFGCYLLSNHLQNYRKSFPVSGLIVILIMLGGGAFLKRGPFSIRNTQDADWKSVQVWAHEQTDRDALFIVPPASTGFRLLSKRSSYGSWFDGTVLFLDLAAAKEWYRRMKVLGWDATRSVSEFFNGYLERPEILTNDSAVKNAKEVFIIYDREEKDSELPVVFRQGRYSIVRLK